MAALKQRSSALAFQMFSPLMELLSSTVSYVLFGEGRGRTELLDLRHHLPVVANRTTNWAATTAAAAAALERHQRRVGCSPVVIAAEVRMVWLYQQMYVAEELLFREPGAPEARHRLDTALAANRQLVDLNPAAAGHLHSLYSSIRMLYRSGTGAEGVAFYRQALRKAEEQKGEAWMGGSAAHDLVPRCAIAPPIIFTISPAPAC